MKSLLLTFFYHFVTFRVWNIPCIKHDALSRSLLNPNVIAVIKTVNTVLYYTERERERDHNCSSQCYTRLKSSRFNIMTLTIKSLIE